MVDKYRNEDNYLLKNRISLSVYENISENPGTYLSKISKELDFSKNSIIIHLRKLRKSGFISSAESTRGRIHYFKNEYQKWDYKLKRIQGLPSVSRQLYEEIINSDKPIKNQKGLSVLSGINPSSVNYRSKLLEKAELVFRIKRGKEVSLIPNPDLFELYDLVWGVGVSR